MAYNNSYDELPSWFSLCTHNVVVVILVECYTLLASRSVHAKSEHYSMCSACHKHIWPVDTTR